MTRDPLQKKKKKMRHQAIPRVDVSGVDEVVETHAFPTHRLPQVRGGCVTCRETAVDAERETEHDRVAVHAGTHVRTCTGPPLTRSQPRAHASASV